MLLVRQNLEPFRSCVCVCWYCVRAGASQRPIAIKHLDGYSTGDAFKEAPLLPPLMADAATATTELWLVQFPVHELGRKDLMGQAMDLHPPDSDGEIGHFYSSRVRRITSNVRFRRLLEVQKDTSLRGRAKSGLTTSEAKSRGDSTRSIQKRALADEKHASTVTQASIGNSELEKESKKKAKMKENKVESEASR